MYPALKLYTLYNIDIAMSNTDIDDNLRRKLIREVARTIVQKNKPIFDRLAKETDDA